MKTMAAILTVLLFLMAAEVKPQTSLPDLTRKSDLADLGSGRILETDKTIIRDIRLIEIKTLAIVYEKKGSLHDLFCESILRIEFPNSKWGGLKIEFIQFKPVISRLD